MICLDSFQIYNPSLSPPYILLYILAPEAQYNVSNICSIPLPLYYLIWYQSGRPRTTLAHASRRVFVIRRMPEGFNLLGVARPLFIVDSLCQVSSSSNSSFNVSPGSLLPGSRSSSAPATTTTSLRFLFTASPRRRRGIG